MPFNAAFGILLRVVAQSTLGATRYISSRRVLAVVSGRPAGRPACGRESVVRDNERERSFFMRGYDFSDENASLKRPFYAAVFAFTGCKLNFTDFRCPLI